MKLNSIKYIFLLLIFSSLFNGAFSQDKDQLSKFGRVLRLLEDHYVDSVDAEKLVEDAIRGMLKELDPHTVYLNKSDVKRLNDPLKGNFEGIGVTFSILKDTVYIISTIDGGPSEKAGIRPGDRIITIDSISVAGIGIKNNEVRERTLGKKGTEVIIGVKRSGSKELIEYKIKRDKIPIKSLAAAYMIDDEIGYIKLSRFSAGMMDEYSIARDSLLSMGMENLILDLGGNGGGYLNIAVELGDEFLKDEQLIVFTEGANNPKKEERASDKGKLDKGRLVLIVNEGSASASEIVSGAIQDWDRGVLVGRRTYGKGLVQRQYPISDGSATRVTIAHYYTPSGRSIQRPYDGGEEEYKNELKNRRKNGELTNIDSIPLNDSLQYKTLKYQRTVYGGGGVMPDVFVPLDTLSFTDYYRDIVRKGIINSYVLDNIDKKRKIFLEEYPDFKTFDQNFIIDSTMVNDIIILAKEDGIEKNPDQLELSYERILTQIKALFARDLYHNSDYQQIINRENETVQKAIEIISSKKKYKSILKGK